MKLKERKLEDGSWRRVSRRNRSLKKGAWRNGMEARGRETGGREGEKG